ncbi:hotdog domain-containing protein [Sorangium sp. So ce406]|uniref:hotdog domain-containing protein n=1 Tax=Sorangium sp. So ce406 TaxID=3133311 RepID=UPI003F5BD432
MKRGRPFQVGDVSGCERCFTDEDVLEFLRISGDAGRHHARPDAQGRRVVHGLLTATIPTRLGGEIDYLAREMTFEFLRPVFTGDTIRCEATITEVVPEAGRVRLAMSGGCWNQDGKEVLRFNTRGVVLDEAE